MRLFLFFPVFCFLFLGVSPGVVRGDDLDVVAAPGTTPEARGEAYGRLAGAEFARIGGRLAGLCGRHRVAEGRTAGAVSKEPWNDGRLSEGERIARTLRQLWSVHTSYERMPKGERAVFFDLLEDEAAGPGRSLVVSELSVRLRGGAGLTAEEAERLERFARDERYPTGQRRAVVAMVYAQGDANGVMDLVLALSEREGTALARGETLRFMTPLPVPAGLSGENVRRYVARGFGWLEESNDGSSGAGYFLAAHLGEYAGVAPVKAGGAAFAPDQSLPQYQGPQGLKAEYFQDTVNHALAWWRAHKGEYGVRGD